MAPEERATRTEQPSPEPISEYAAGEVKRDLARVGIGAVLAFLIGFLPFAPYALWFFGALCHEIGHSVVAWFFGMPAFPAIRLDGHAVAMHKDQSTLLVFVIAAGLTWSAWKLRDRLPWAIPLGLLALLQPILAFTEAKQVLFLFAGHLGELAFAGVFLWRALTGGFTHSGAERICYAMLSVSLIRSVGGLAIGLRSDAAERAEYRGSGSFGLKNDLLRVAEDHWGTDVAEPAGWLLLAVPLPILIVFGVWGLRFLGRPR